MDIRKIRRLIELLEGSDVTEIEISEGEESVRVSRGQAQPPPPPSAAPPPAPPPQVSSAQAPAAAAPAQPEVPEETGLYQEAPMVGTFYRAPTPESDPYVREGDHVNVGDTLCVIEAMKLFNEIEAEHAGRIEKILVENAQPVEFGEPLFLIDPEG
ncbi:acetyl-CoA carboxylase biotin carboxyl carrier protein [Thiohalorhabdus sp.]|uniref:acetyl-CoA carboxylase biotin carboxyl carrier protein n=1 Tax=Thiohalorhabdus sp. TaxID=3094134 RepID=UPI002FC2AD66